MGFNPRSLGQIRLSAWQIVLMYEASVVSTKLYRPRPARSLVERPRLLDRLNNRLHRRRLTIVTAPPGYGKTTLVSHWLSTLDSPTTWITLDKLNNDLNSFARYLTATVESAYSGSCRLSAALLTSQQQPPPAVWADALIEDLANLPGDLVIALDDFYTVDDPSVHEYLERVVQYMPTNCHLIIASRETPPWSLGRLRLSGELVEVGMEDLCFTTAEAQRFLEGLLKKPLSDAVVESLERHTEGWAAGLQMAAIGLGNMVDNVDTEAGLRQDRVLIREYLIDEVLTNQTAAIRDFLLRTSILNRLCDPLARATLGMPPIGTAEPDSGTPTMGRLMRANLFLTPLDSRHSWFRYHSLFQELLQRRLAEEVTREEIVAMHRRAGAWFASQGLVEEAIHHAVLGDDESMIVRVVAAHMHESLNSERWGVLVKWLELVPEPLRSSNPLFLICRGYILLFQLRIKGMMAIVPKIEARLAAQGGAWQSDGQLALQAQIDLIKTAGAYWAGDAGKAIALAEQSLRHLGPEMLWARSTVEFYRASAHHTAGRSATGLACVQQALDSQTQRIDAISSRLYLAQGNIHLGLGHFQQFQHVTEILGKIGERGSLPLTTGWYHFAVGIQAYEWNDLPRAEKHLRQVTLAPYEVNGRTALECFIGLALTLDALGRPEAADAEVERLHDFLVQGGHQAAQALVGTTEQWLATSRSMPSGLNAAEEVLTREATLDDLSLSFWFTPLAGRARALIGREIVCLTDDRAREARAILEACRVAAESVYQQRFVARILALEASLAAACGDESAALDALRRSLRLAEPGRLIRTYVDCGPRLIPLLEQLRDDFPASNYVERLLGAFASSAASAARPATDAASVEPYLQMQASLTNRELEVLLLLADRLSNKEIATRMFIAPETVKRYNLRIFQKLGVNNRRAAVSLARHLGLIPA